MMMDERGWYVLVIVAAAPVCLACLAGCLAMHKDKKGPFKDCKHGTALWRCDKGCW